MTSMLKRFSVAAGLVALAGGGIAAAYQATGAVIAAGQPTVVVTVNLGAVLEKLDQRADLDANLKTMTDKLKTENEQRTAEVTKMQADMDKLLADLQNAAHPKQKDEIQTQIDTLQETGNLTHLKHQAWARFNESKMDVEAALAYQDLYRNIKTAIAQMAGAAKYDVVLVDDSRGELSTDPDSRLSKEAQIIRQIIGRRMLYANPAIDITDDLIVRMNNAHKASNGKAN